MLSPSLFTSERCTMMSSFFFSFLQKYPETFADLQESLDRLVLPIQIQLGKEGPFEVRQKEKLGAFVPVKFNDSRSNAWTETNVWMYLDPLSSMTGVDDIRKQVGDRNLAITFEYHSKWRPACSSLAICAALMSDFDALTYNNFMNTGFITKEEVLAGVHEYLDKYQGKEEEG